MGDIHAEKMQLTGAPDVPVLQVSDAVERTAERVSKKAARTTEGQAKPEL